MGSIQQGLGILSAGSTEFTTGSAIADGGFDLIGVILGVFVEVASMMGS